MFSLKRGIPEWQEAVVPSLSQHLQKMADASSLFSRQWHLQGSGRLFHLLEASWNSRLATSLGNPHWSPGKQTVGASAQHRHCFPLFPFPTPGKPAWLLPLPLQVQGVCKMGCPWRRVDTQDGSTLFQQHQQLLSASLQVSGKNRISRLYFSGLSHSLWFPQLFLCQEKEHHGFGLGQRNPTFYGFPEKPFPEPQL